MAIGCGSWPACSSNLVSEPACRFRTQKKKEDIMNSAESNLRSFGGRAYRPTASKTIYSSLLAVVSLRPGLLLFAPCRESHSFSNPESSYYVNRVSFHFASNSQRKDSRSAEMMKATVIGGGERSDRSKLQPRMDTNRRE
jgi:hypothetical protein